MTGAPTGVRRILVTGAGGFTGGHLWPLLSARGFEPCSLEQEGGSAQAIDLRDAEMVKEAVRRSRPQGVIHLAGLSFVGHEPASDFYDVNLFGTLNLLDALASLEEPPRKVILASTANLYGAAARPLLDETVCPRPINHYGASKLAMEHLAATYFRRLPIIIARPFNYTGAGQAAHFLIPKIVGHFRRGETSVELGNLKVARDFSDVRDICEAYLRLLTCEAEGEVVNLCSGQATPLESLLAILQELAGYEIEVRVNQQFVRANEIESLRGSVEKLHALVGAFERRPLRDTLSDMLKAG